MPSGEIFFIYYARCSQKMVRCTYNVPSPIWMAMSCNGTIFSCLRRFKILISRKAVIGIPSFSLCIKMRFNANSSPDPFLRALCTSLFRPWTLVQGKAGFRRTQSPGAMREYQNTNEARIRAVRGSDTQSPSQVSIILVSIMQICVLPKCPLS